jgi:3-dehydroquinate dehydratase type I
MICTCIAYKNYEQCRRILQRAELAELRLDLLDLTRDQVRRLSGLPAKIIATCREGKFPDNERMALLETAIMSGAAYVDIELEMPGNMKESLNRLAKEKGCKVIISYHNFEKTPEFPELMNIIKRCSDAGADTIKVACMVNNPEDSANLMHLYSKVKNIISFGMGVDGLITRLAAPLLGAEFTYAAADNASKTGPGQVTVREMKSFYRILGFKDNPISAEK